MRNLTNLIMMLFISRRVIGCVSLTLFLFPAFLFAQRSGFKVGSGSMSIEPQHNVFSLSLAGYGGPRDGRFTLMWEDVGDFGASINDVVCIGSKVIMLKDNDIWSVDQIEKTSAPMQLTTDGGILQIAAHDKSLYAINDQHEVIETVLSARLKWKKVGAVPESIQAMAFVRFGQAFILADKEGNIWQSNHTGRDLKWDKVSHCRGLIDLFVHERRLYGLTDENAIVYHEPNDNWLRVAIKNNQNYQHDIWRIAVSNEVLYGVSNSGAYYKAAHYSDGDLEARTVSIKKDRERVVIVGLDVCGFDADFINEIKEELFVEYAIPASGILINASHTHYAPVTQRWTTWGEHCQRPDSLYLYTTVKRGIINAVRLAIRSEKPASLSFGRGTADIGRNRNLPGDDLPYDKDLDVIRIDYKKNRPSDMLFLAGCHPVFNSSEKEFYKLSANYPGVAREILDQRSEIGSSLFLQGCGGDINPVDGDDVVTGRKVATSVLDVLENGSLTEIEGNISHFLDTVHFPTRPWTEQELRKLKAENEKHIGEIYPEERVRWANLMLGYLENGTMPTDMPVFIQTINIGNWKLIGMSRETTTEYSIAIKKLWPEKLITVAGYSNDVSSYLPTSRHIKAKIYEGDDSFFWYGQPSVFPENVHEVIIDSIRTKGR